MHLGACSQLTILMVFAQILHKIFNGKNGRGFNDSDKII